MKSMLYKILSSKALSFPRKFFLGILLDYLRSMQREVITLVTVDETWKLVSKIKKEVERLLPVDQAEKIYLAVIATKKVPGDIAEAGVYQGGSARLICEAKGDKPLHLFDTFEGLPEVAHIDDGFHRGQFKESLENVKRYLVRYENVYFHKGLIPSTFDPIKDISFSFRCRPIRKHTKLLKLLLSANDQGRGNYIT